MLTVKLKNYLLFFLTLCISLISPLYVHWYEEIQEQETQTIVEEKESKEDFLFLSHLTDDGIVDEETREKVKNMAFVSFTLIKSSLPTQKEQASFIVYLFKEIEDSYWSDDEMANIFRKYLLRAYLITYYPDMKK